MSIRNAARWAEHPAVHLALLAGWSIWQLVISWRRWPDPVVDFGRELYIPWRLAEGAVLYRDVEDFYGPLSHYFNAVLFRVFGPGMMVLVTANLIIFAAIVTLLYLLVRRAWSAWAALAGGMVFVSVFGFSRYVYVGNFNYATPYAHETTHGMLVLLLLAMALVKWCARPTIWLSAVVGLLCGLTLVLKPEIMLAAAAMTAAAAAWRVWQERPLGLREVSAVGIAAAAPTALFVAYLSRHVAFAESWSYAGRAWLNVLGTTRYIAEPAQLKYAGLDTPALHLREHALATLAALALFGGVGFAIWIFERRARSKAAVLLALLWGATLSVGGWLLSWPWWIEAGRCLPGLMLAYVIYGVVRLLRHRPKRGEGDLAQLTRLTVAVLGASLLVRMILAGKIYQFGYYQAAVAAVVVVALLVHELPARCGATSAGRFFGGAIGFVVLLPGIVLLGEKSREIYRHVNSPMGNGGDRFYMFKPSEPLSAVAAVLEKEPRGSTLMVLPEGLMLNYLARMPSPVPHFFFYSAVTEHGNEARLVAKLDAAPPDFVVMLPRDLREYGITNYGERSGAGGDILAWMQGRYELYGWWREGAPEPEPPVNVVAYRDRYFQIYRKKR